MQLPMMRDAIHVRSLNERLPGQFVVVIFKMTSPDGYV
jgi:hypothetical protein